MELKELKDLLKVLRNNGVLEYSSETLQLKLSDEFLKPKRTEPAAADDQELVEPDWDSLSEDEKLFYSAS